MADSAELAALVTKLQRANWAYYNGGEEVMSDDEYDRGIEELRRKSPAHPLLTQIGAPPAKGSTLLPYTMASLDKLRFGEGNLGRWLARQTTSSFVAMEKLDGLSALLVVGPKKKSLYLRGDGVKGVDISRCLKYIQIPSDGPDGPQTSYVIRGEIILPLSATPAGKIGRSLVNGWVHRSLDAAEPPAELADCHFVAYQVIEPAGMTRSQQIDWLTKNGFKVPMNKAIKRSELTEEKAKEILMSWRESSAYPLDGIVLGADKIPEASPGGEAKNPSDSAAFKAALDEQRAETCVKGVEWNLSRQNLWIPTICIEPVAIGGAMISRLSGHNMKLIQENGIGPGARIVIRRSGDVIPTLDETLDMSTELSEPPAGSWEWDETCTHARRVEGADVGDEEAAAKAIQHALQTLEVEGIGPGLVKKMVEEGFLTMATVVQAEASAASKARLAKAIGAGRAPQFMAALRTAIEKASPMIFLIASNLLPRGVAEKKLRPLFAVQADPRKWATTKFGKVAGWTEESLQTTLGAVPKALAWAEATFGKAATAVSVEAPAATPMAGLAAPVASQKQIVFTGVRDKEIVSKMASLGWVMGDSVTKQTNILVIADDAEGQETVKTKKARAQGTEILPLTQFRQRVNAALQAARM